MYGPAGLLVTCSPFPTQPFKGPVAADSSGALFRGVIFCLVLSCLSVPLSLGQVKRERERERDK